jgi:SAM-dependent methyltransferase
MVRRDGDRYLLTTTGACILSDEMTGINMDFVQHCCYQAMYYLEDSIRERRPAGLQKIFGDWDTIYPSLPTFPEPARSSWFRFDHYYSDAAFPQALPIVFERRHRRLLDVGGNTGKWAIQCARYSADVSVTILDHPGLVAAATRNAEELGLQDRIMVRAVELLDHSLPLPEGYDAIWMSQFLMCLGEDDALGILKRAATAMGPDSTLYILDLFWDRQKFEASTYCLQAVSLYFTCLATGRSRMYKASDVTAMVEAAGLKVERVIDDLGISSSMLICRR